MISGPPPGMLSFRGAVMYPAGPQPDGVAIGDLNGDGLKDLVVTSGFVEVGGEGGVYVLLNKGGGTFAEALRTPGGATPSWPSIGDLNGDGLEDLVVLNFHEDTAAVRLGNGDGTFAPADDYALGRGATMLTVADLERTASSSELFATSQGG